MLSERDCRRIVTDCGIAAGDVIHVHSGAGWLGSGINPAMQMMKSLIDAVGPSGTICMPSYTWRFPDAVGEPANSIVDLRRSPSKLGLLSELFRRWPSVKRSASHWLPICALGSRAEEFIADQASIVDPFGPGSTLRRLVEADAKLLGIGVALGASSMSHLPDHDLAPYYKDSVFNDTLLRGRIIDADGRELNVQSLTIRREIMAAYTPSATFTYSDELRAKLIFRKHNDAFISCLPAKLYHAEAVRIGAEFLADGRLPPWLTGPRWMPTHH